MARSRQLSKLFDLQGSQTESLSDFIGTLETTLAEEIEVVVSPIYKVPDACADETQETFGWAQSIHRDAQRIEQEIEWIKARQDSGCLPYEQSLIEAMQTLEEISE